MRQRWRPATMRVSMISIGPPSHKRWHNLRARSKRWNQVPVWPQFNSRRGFHMRCPSPRSPLWTIVTSRTTCERSCAEWKSQNKRQLVATSSPPTRTIAQTLCLKRRQKRWLTTAIRLSTSNAHLSRTMRMNSSEWRATCALSDVPNSSWAEDFTW